LANSLKSDLNQIEGKFPLTLVFCSVCSLVQLKETVSKEILFKSYVWVTGTSKTAREFSEEFYKYLEKYFFQEKIFAIEIASNDGTFLKPFKKRGHKVLGVDPAENIAKIANENEIPTINEFFDSSIANSLVNEYGEADCVFARNVVPHSEDLHGVIAGIKNCLKPNGIGAIEFHYTQSILDETQYDSIYHEHLSYFSLSSLCYLLEKHYLHAFDIMESPISGGALIVYFSKNKRVVSKKIEEKRMCEDKTGLSKKEKWEEFSSNCLAHKRELVALIKNEVEKGKRLIAYGASARSSTLLNFCELNNIGLECIADGNPIKHGKYAPGTQVPILSPDVALSKKTDTILLLAWNFKDEILSVLKNKYGFNGKVILPLPTHPYMVEI
jgi:SAM-dependent methyltransferase